MDKSAKHLLTLSFTILSLLLTGCGNIMMPSRRSTNTSSKDEVSFREDLTSLDVVKMLVE